MSLLGEKEGMWSYTSFFFLLEETLRSIFSSSSIEISVVLYSLWWPPSAEIVCNLLYFYLMLHYSPFKLSWKGLADKPRQGIGTNFYIQLISNSWEYMWSISLLSFVGIEDLTMMCCTPNFSDCSPRTASLCSTLELHLIRSSLFSQGITCWCPSL